MAFGNPTRYMMTCTLHSSFYCSFCHLTMELSIFHFFKHAWWHSRYWRLDPKKAVDGPAGWDTAIADASTLYNGRIVRSNFFIPIFIPFFLFFIPFFPFFYPIFSIIFFHFFVSFSSFSILPSKFISIVSNAKRLSLYSSTISAVTIAIPMSRAPSTRWRTTARPPGIWCACALRCFSEENMSGIVGLRFRTLFCHKNLLISKKKFEKKIRKKNWIFFFKLQKKIRKKKFEKNSKKIPTFSLLFFHYSLAAIAKSWLPFVILLIIVITAAVVLQRWGMILRTNHSTFFPDWSRRRFLFVSFCALHFCLIDLVSFSVCFGVPGKCAWIETVVSRMGKTRIT